MVQKLQEKCREARDRLGYTNQDIADATGIPLSSVKNFFAATSKVPGLVYAGLICKFRASLSTSAFALRPPRTPKPGCGGS